MTNYYNILGLEVDANYNEIKTAYRKLSKKFHPDLNPEDKFFHKMFLQIQEAYEILSDKELRTKYDLILQNVYQAPLVKSNTPSNVPIIENFSVDKDYIASDEAFTITWKVENADFVQIRPLGMFPTEGFETFKFTEFKVESINIVLIATDSMTGLSARKHIVINNKSWKPSFFEDNKKMDLLITTLRVLFVLIIIFLLVMIVIFGIEVNDPLKDLQN